MTQTLKIAWVTGASQGIGRAVTLLLAKQGMHVIASARSADKLEQLRQESKHLLGDIEPLRLDVTDSSAVQEAVKYILYRYEHIDLVVLNAGTFIPMKASEFRAEVVQQQLTLNVMGVSHCLEPLIQQMQRQGYGQIAINASLSGYRGLPKASAYGASKAALINMAECLHGELKDKGVDVRLINPGFVKTPLTDKNTFPMPFLVSSEQAAERIVKGLKGKGFEIRFPGIFGFLMGVLRALPYRAYFALTKRITAVAGADIKNGANWLRFCLFIKLFKKSFNA